MYRINNKIMGEIEYSIKFTKEKPENFRSISAKIKIIKAKEKIIYFFK